MWKIFEKELKEKKLEIFGKERESWLEWVRNEGEMKNYALAPSFISFSNRAPRSKIQSGPRLDSKSKPKTPKTQLNSRTSET